MNRLFHLKQTIIENIKQASTYSEVEFVLLDYNSQDGLETWVKENLSEYIKSGIVKFYQTKEPKYWCAAHAKNIAHKMATGDILVNIDSDIRIPEGFCEYIKDLFSSGQRLVMSFESSDPYGYDGCAGIVGAKREDFYSVNGYDESISLGWGYDDMNYQFRVRMQNNLILFTPPKICLCIPHSNEVRTENCQLKDIEATKDLSYFICEDSAMQKDYIANKSIDWGKANLVENFTRTLQI
jgi:glycosyltransferase involved in cell wall biosynthesis